MDGVVAVGVVDGVGFWLDFGSGTTILLAVTVPASTRPTTRTVVPTGNCCCVAGCADVPNFVAVVIVTVTCLPVFVVTIHDVPFSELIRPLTPVAALCAADVGGGATVVDVADIAAPAEPSQPDTPSATPVHARATPPTRSHVHRLILAVITTVPSSSSVFATVRRDDGDDGWAAAGNSRCSSGSSTSSTQEW